MRKCQNTLLAGVAALALVAGTDFASAQTPNGGGGGGQGGQQHATQPGGNGPGTHAQGQGGVNRTAQSPSGGAKTNATGGGQQPQQNATGGQNNTQQDAQGNEHGNMQRNASGPNNRENAQNTNRNNRNGTASNERGTQHRRRSAAERQHIPQGLQGNASGQTQGNNRNSQAPQGTAQNSGAKGQVRGANVKLSEQQRTRIRETIIQGSNAPRVDHVNFTVNVGTPIPRAEFVSIHVVPVPEYLVRIEPRWRGLEYFIYTDEVVIVDPHDLRIVAIIAV